MNSYTSMSMALALFFLAGAEAATTAGMMTARHATFGAVTTAFQEGTTPHSESLHQMMQEMKMEIQKLNESLSRLQQSRAAGYDLASFLAVRTSNQAVGPKGIVKFPIVKHNLAPQNFGYDDQISVYRCPHNGTYVFSVSISVSNTGKYHAYSIVKEGESLGTAYTYNQSGNNACSATVTTRCKRGQIVWVENSQTETLTVHSSSTQPRTHFTGYRIH